MMTNFAGRVPLAFIRLCLGKVFPLANSCPTRIFVQNGRDFISLWPWKRLFPQGRGSEVKVKNLQCNRHQRKDRIAKTTSAKTHSCLPFVPLVLALSVFGLLGLRTVCPFHIWVFALLLFSPLVSLSCRRNTGMEYKRERPWGWLPEATKCHREYRPIATSHICNYIGLDIVIYFLCYVLREKHTFQIIHSS